MIPDKYTPAVRSPVSPPLNWENGPAGTISFTLILHDPETVPEKGSADFLHWLVFNIPATAQGLPESMPIVAQLPDGIMQVRNRRGEPGYMGPAARNFYHHYTFELYALDTKLNVGTHVTRSQLMAAMDGHVIGKAVLVGRFHR